jgi:hypothetical protein
MSISYFVHALEAEMLGRVWEVPLPLHEGLDVNVLEESLDNALDQTLGLEKSQSSSGLIAYRSVTPATV